MGPGLVFTVQFSSVQSLSRSVVSTLCNPMNRSMPGLSVHHHLPEFTQTHVHRVCDAIQPSHPGSSLCTSPKPPVSCIEPRLAICFLHDIIHVSMPFSHIIPPSPSTHRVQKSLLYICVSFAVLHTGLSLPSF